MWVLMEGMVHNAKILFMKNYKRSVMSWTFGCAVVAILAACRASSSVLIDEDIAAFCNKIVFSRHVLWNKEPCAKWIEGFPIGNGRLGTMVLGNLNEEFIINEDTLWASRTKRNRVGAFRHLDKLKQLIREEEYTEAEALVEAEFLSPRNTSLTNRPLCKLKLKLHEEQATTSYYRLLDMEHGIATVAYEIDQSHYMREQFVSHPDQVLAIRLASSKANNISCRFGIEGFTKLAFDRKTGDLFFTGEVEEGGTAFAAGIRVTAANGSVVCEEGGIQVQDADSVLLLMTVGTDYCGDDPMKICGDRLGRLKNKSYAELKRNHIADHKALYNRADIQLGQKPQLEELSTGERVAAVGAGEDDAFLASQYFQLGRYLLIASSRPGCMPSHLHGLWIKDWAPKYNCAYHLNVNIEMNYWPAEVGNLSELHVPFFDFIDALRENGRTTAREVYDCNGFVLHHNVDGTLETGPFGKAEWGFWPMGAAWACQNVWSHYLFSEDRKFLREKGYPIIREAAEFVYDYLMENPDTGKLIFGPSTSPENFFLTSEGEKAHVMTGVAMDQELTWDLFTNCIAAAEVLGLEDEFTGKLVRALERLEKPQIGKDGRVLEWRLPLKEASPHHRHVSHLFAVYPGHQFTAESEVELYEASIKSLETRIQEREKLNFRQVPAWAKAYSMLIWARFQRADDAYTAYKQMFKYGQISNNLFVAFGHDRVIMDANGGGAAGIAEMLIQSHKGYVELLPALPSQWNEGSFRGLRAVGGFEVDLAWKDGKWQEATVKSDSGKVFRLRAAPSVRVMRNNTPIDVVEKNGILEFPMEAGASYLIVR